VGTIEKVGAGRAGSGEKIGGFLLTDPAHSTPAFSNLPHMLTESLEQAMMDYA